MAPHSSTLAWKIPWAEEPGGLLVTLSRVTKSQTRLSDFTFTFHFHTLEKEMATHFSVLAWRIPGTREPGGLPSLGSHRVGHDWSDLAAARVQKSFPGGASSKESACQCRKHKRPGFCPWVGKIPWRRAWQPTPLFLPGKFHGQSLPGYSPLGCRVR